MTHSPSLHAGYPLTVQAAPVARRFRPSTQLLIFLLLLIGLAPLGLLGVYATLKGNAVAERERAGLIDAAGIQMTRSLATELTADRALVRRSLQGIPLDQLFPEEAQRICADLRLAYDGSELRRPKIYIVGPDFARELCRGRGEGLFDDAQVPNAPVQGLAAIDAENGLMTSSVMLPDPVRPYTAVLAYTPRIIGDMANVNRDLPDFELSVVGQGEELVIEDLLDMMVPGGALMAQHRIGDSGLSLRLRTGRVALSRAELVSLAAPIAMWLVAAFASWLLLSVLIMRPLSRLHRSVAAYRPGAVFIRPRRRRATALEITQLERDFSDLSETVAADKAELAKGLQRQTALTREVHHRVKNNLQIIASLINLHSRAATDPEAETAYRSIQRRVDALSVVHRNHYAEIEDHAGLSLRPLITELASSLRASTEDAGIATPVSVAVAPLNVSQDVAVPVSFLITEIAELAIQIDPAERIEIRVERDDARPGFAELSIRGAALRQSELLDHLLATRYQRVLTGLARQLREELRYDGVQGGYGIGFATYAPAPERL